MGDLEYCSPSAIANEHKICYSKKSLLTLLKVWNNLLPLDKISYNPDESPNDLFGKLNEKFKYYLHKDNTYWSWTEILKFIALKMDKPKMSNVLRTIEKEDLRPPQPEDWISNPTEWLSNFDINNCLVQYNYSKRNKYKFLGVYSIDFGIPNNPFNIRKILEENPNVSYLGFVTNLSRASEAGTHWTSSFFVFDPSLKSFGGYYYDSTTGGIPKDLQPVFNDIKRQAEELFKKDFPISINNVRHQFSNTECGIFSIAFQTRWLFLLRTKNGDVEFDEVVKFEGYKDKIMKELRNKLFRPNIKSLKNK
jgi:hypothetical protein